MMSDNSPHADVCAHDPRRTHLACVEGRAMPGRDWVKSWHDAEKAAADAEAEVARLGQAAADPRVAELFARAKALRDEANALLEEMLVKSGAKPETRKR
jgi:hypothetical protein